MMGVRAAGQWSFSHVTDDFLGVGTMDLKHAGTDIFLKDILNMYVRTEANWSAHSCSLRPAALRGFAPDGGVLVSAGGRQSAPAQVFPTGFVLCIKSCKEGIQLLWGGGTAVTVFECVCLWFSVVCAYTHWSLVRGLYFWCTVSHSSSSPLRCEGICSSPF